MTRQRKIHASGRTILLVDDSPEYVQATKVLLEQEGHEVVSASNGEKALELLRTKHIDLMLLDFFMPGMTGEEVVKQLREFNAHVQVILQTGYSGDRPAREMLHRLDIQGYHDKSEGPEKLLLWTDVGLKSAAAVQVLTRSREGLQYILNITPDLHKIQPVTTLLQGILLQVTGLLGVGDSFLAVMPKRDGHEADSFVALIDEESELVVQARTGEFSDFQRVADVLSPGTVAAINEKLWQQRILVEESCTVVALEVGETAVGLIYLDRAVTTREHLDLLALFANQAAVAIHNAELYELATVDRLTGLHVRSYFDKWLYRELRTAFRSQTSFGLIMLDLDGLKRINDDNGHQAGDRALAAVGDVLRLATRDSDILGRYGGDEFAVMLPRTDRRGVEIVASRITDAFKLLSPHGLQLRASMGACIVDPHELQLADLRHMIDAAYFEEVGLSVMGAADAAMYTSKHDGRGQLRIAPSAQWPAIDRHHAPQH
jgi:two-component system cell cycle response regulator